MKAYWAEFKMHRADKVHGIDVLARDKASAYDKAVNEAIPEKYGEHPYSAWVVSVTYQNGNRRQFDTMEGKPY